MVWIVWMAVAPVPMMPPLAGEVDRLFRPSRGVERLPLEIVAPSIRGRVGVESGPIAVIRKRELKRLPSSSVIVQLLVPSS